MSILELISKILMIVLLIIEIAVMVYLFYINRKRYQADKKYWEKQEIITSGFIKQLENNTRTISEEENNQKEEDTSNGDK